MQGLESEWWTQTYCAMALEFQLHTMGTSRDLTNHIALSISSGVLESLNVLIEIYSVLSVFFFVTI